MTLGLLIAVAVVFLLIGMGIGMMMPFLGILATVFWIWMIFDCMTAKFKQKEHKIAWLLVIIFTHILGALIYFFLVRKKG